MQADIKSEREPAEYLVAGWFTPDYRHHLVGLTADLDRDGHPYFFEEVLKEPAGWAANTRQKSRAILRAIDRHPGVRLIWLDVDCRILGDIAPLAAISTDFAVHTKSQSMKQRKNRDVGRYRAIIHPWTGTMVISPTSRARKLIEVWQDIELYAMPLDTDETALGFALSRVPELSLTILGHRWCSSPREVAPDAIIQHGRGRPAQEIEQDIAKRNNRPIRALKQRIISRIVGKPYTEWKRSRVE